MSNTTDIAIVNGARTPMGRYCGKLRDFTAMDLGAIAATEAMKRSGVEPGEIDHCRHRQCAADFGRFHLRRAARRTQSRSSRSKFRR